MRKLEVNELRGFGENTAFEFRERVRRILE